MRSLSGTGWSVEADEVTAGVGPPQLNDGFHQWPKGLNQADAVRCNKGPAFFQGTGLAVSRA